MWFDVSFGNSKAGLDSVGYRQYNNQGDDAVARTKVGVVEIGHGAYGCDITLDDDAVGIEWDTGEQTPLYAHESVPRLITVESLVNSILDILQGDHDESSSELIIKKKGTETILVRKTITGSLLPAAVVVKTREPS